MSICNKIEKLQYIAALAITRAIRGSSKEKLYRELGFEYLSSRRWLKKLCLFYKNVLNKFPNYPYNNRSYQTRSSGKFLHMCCRTEHFENSFFPYSIKEWNNLSLGICKSESYEVFKNSVLKFIRTSPNSLFNVSDSLGIKLLTSLESESTTHFFSACKNSTDLRKRFMNELIKIDSCILTLHGKSFTKLFLYGDGDMTAKQTKV